MKGSLRFLVLALAMTLFLGGLAQAAPAGSLLAQDTSVTTGTGGSTDAAPSGGADATFEADVDVTESTESVTTVETESQPAATRTDVNIATDNAPEANGYGDEIFWAVVGLLVLGLIIWMFSAGNRNTTVIERRL